jgi:hypothetical protein
MTEIKHDEPFELAEAISVPKRCINIPINQGCHSREGGNLDRNPGFRVKPGMTDVEGLQK